MKRQQSPYRPWTTEEIAILIRRYPTEGPYPLRDVLNRTEPAITVKATKLGLPRLFKRKPRCHSQQVPSPYQIEFRKWLIVQHLPMDVMEQLRHAS
jgi:hypothetical protein